MELLRQTQAKLKEYARGIRHREISNRKAMTTIKAEETNRWGNIKPNKREHRERPGHIAGVTVRVIINDKADGNQKHIVWGRWGTGGDGTVNQS